MTYVTARFRRAFDRLDQLEGGWANNPNDRGGETYRGVSRKWFPAWPGWARVDAAKARPNFPANLAADPALAELVRDFYLDEWWSRLRANQLTDERVALSLFFFAVNAGREPAVAALQVALNGLGRPVSADGRIGPATLAAANAVAGDRLLAAFEAQARRHYRTLAAKDPSQAAHLNGWFSRLFTQETTNAE